MEAGICFEIELSVATGVTTKNKRFKQVKNRMKAKDIISKFRMKLDVDEHDTHTMSQNSDVSN